VKAFCYFRYFKRSVNHHRPFFFERLDYNCHICLSNSNCMKKIKLIYWISTSLFSAFMTFTAIPDIFLEPGAVAFISKLGYPEYFIVFIGIAKLLGSIAILIPGFPRIKEWAYAGLFFDLIGALYSILAVEELNASIAFMLLPFILGITSYVYHRKLLQTNT